MKTKKTTLAMVVITAMIFAITGCTVSSGNEANNDFKFFTEEGVRQLKESGHTIEEILEMDRRSANFSGRDGSRSGLEAAIIGFDVIGTDLKDDVVNVVSTSRLTRENSMGLTAEQQQQANFVYSNNRIPELRDFYLPTVEIDGFVLYSVEINSQSFRYLYAPSGRDIEETRSNYIHGMGFCITISRTDTSRTAIQQFETDSQTFGLTDDNMVFLNGSGIVIARFGDTTVSVEMLSRLNDYEFLRDIATRAFKTAELVNVDREIARMASETTPQSEFTHSIDDVLEILKYIAGLDNTIEIVDGAEPTIHDALEILKKIAGI
jgi:hypothetical protein